MLSFSLLPFPEMETERLLLRRISHEDAEDMFAMRTNPTVMQYIGRERLAAVKDALALIELMEQGLMQNTGITWGISMKGEKAMIGTLGFWRIDKQNHRAEIGYMIMPEHMGKGLMSEAIQKILSYGFNELNLHSIEANIDPLNKASRNILIRNGFVKEAYFKENFFFNGEFFDSEIYSLVSSKQ